MRKIRDKWSRSVSKEELLNRELSDLDRQYGSLIKEAKSAGKWQEIEGLESQKWFEQEPYIADLRRLETERWRSDAREFHVPVPEIKDEPDENWNRMTVQMDGTNCWYLTETAKSHIWTLIRERKKDLREERLAYISALGSVITALTGLLGAAIGILAILHHVSK